MSFVLYGNSIQNDYGFDDAFVVKGNKYVQKGTEGIQEIFDMPYAELDGIKLDKRPIPLISFALEHQFIGDNPHVSHFINVLLYALTLIILYIVLSKVFHLDKVQTFLPFIITVFFAVHPLHTEVVNSLKNRDELLVLLFGLLYLLFGYFSCIKKDKRWLYVFLSLFFLALVLMSKITGLIFVGIFFLLFIFNRFYKNKWNYIFFILCIAFVVRAILVVFENINRTTSIFENPLIQNKDLFTHLGTASNILLYHIKMLLYPSPLRFYYGANMFPLVELTNPAALFSFAAHFSLFVYGLIRFFKKDVLGLVILCYFMSIALFANLPIPYTSMFSERALLLSSLWFIAIVSVFIIRIWIKKYALIENKIFKNIFFLFLMMAFTGYSFITINRNFYWKNSITLMEHDIEYLDNSILANYIYASNLKYESKISKDSLRSKILAKKAVYHFEQAIRLAPNYPEFYFKLASTYRYNLNNLDSAEVNFGYAISIDSLYADAYFELSKVFFDRQDFRRSNYFFKKTYNLQPKDSLTLFYYAQSSAKVGDISTSYKINLEFLKLYPDLQYPYLNLGVYYTNILKDDSAVIYFDKAIELGYREKELLNKMAFYYKQKGDTQKVRYYRSLNY